MRLLEERIRKDGLVKPGDVLKVDNFLNHQIDVALVRAIGEEFADVCMYGFQLMDCLGIDLSRQIENKIKKVSERPSGMRGRYADELLRQQQGGSHEGNQ